MGEKLGLSRRSDFGGIFFPFLGSKRPSNMEEKI